SRARVRASSRSSFLRLSPISRTLRAFATTTSCPNSLSKRLIQGECVPISSAIRLCGSSPKTSRNPFACVRTRCSRCIWPDSSSTQYQLLRSPRSNPTVNFCCEIFLPGFSTTVLTFFIAGLLFICALSTSITWERTPHPVRRPAFSSHLITSTIESFPSYKTKLSSIRRPDVVDLHRHIGRTHGKYIANRVFELLSSIFNRARRDWGYEGANPAEAI